MTRNITLKIQLNFCGTSGSQALMHLSVVSLPTTFSRGKGTASIEVQAAAASLFLQFDDAHAWYKSPSFHHLITCYHGNTN